MMDFAPDSPRIILASTSPYRRAQLEQFQIPFECVSPNVDEDAFKADEQNPRKLALELAIAKAEAVARIHPDAIVIGGDQLVAHAGTILGKPHTPAAAVDQLMQLAGRQHELITAIAVCHSERRQTHVDETRLWMRPIDRETAERYVATDQPLDCAGSYKIESLGLTLFERIESEDHTAIMGVPLLALGKILNNAGILLP